MKLMVVWACVVVWPVVCAMAQKEGQTYSSLDAGGGRDEETFPAGLLKFTDADLPQVLNVYGELSGRTIVHSATLPAAKVTVRSQTALTRVEALQALDSVLAQNGIVMIPQGRKFVKAVAKQAAPLECPPFVDVPREQLPDCGSYIAYMVEVKHTKPSRVAQALQPFAGMPNSIVGMDEAGVIVLRDFSSNVRRMLEVLERIDKEPMEESEKSSRAKARGKRSSSEPQASPESPIGSGSSTTSK